MFNETCTNEELISGFDTNISFYNFFSTDAMGNELFYGEKDSEEINLRVDANEDPIGLQLKGIIGNHFDGIPISTPNCQIRSPFF